MAVIAKYKIGNSKIVIHDDDCVKTPEERKQILDSISRLAASCVSKGGIKDVPMEFEDSIIDVGPDGDWDSAGTLIYPGRPITA